MSLGHTFALPFTGLANEFVHLYARDFSECCHDMVDSVSVFSEDQYLTFGVLSPLSFD